MVYAGSLQFLYFDDLYGESKEKRCLTVSTDPYIFLLISSEVPGFIKRIPEKAERQILIDYENHDCILTYDSYIDCTEPHPLHIDDLQRQIQDNHKRVRGSASKEVLGKVVTAIDDSPILTARVQGIILDSLNPLIDLSN